MHNQSNHNNESYFAWFLNWMGFISSSEEQVNNKQMSDSAASQTSAESSPELSVESVVSNKPKTALSLAQMLANQRKELKHVEMDTEADAAKKQRFLKERVLLKARLANPN